MRRAFDDPERGSSPLVPGGRSAGAASPASAKRWCAGSPSTSSARGAAYMDLSVLHDNEQAIALYEKLGFRRVPLLRGQAQELDQRAALRRRPPADEPQPLCPHHHRRGARRGIDVEVTDAEGGFFRLTHGGRSVHCRESLSELTCGVAVSICDDKAVTRRVVARAGRARCRSRSMSGRRGVDARSRRSCRARQRRGEAGAGRAGAGRRGRPDRRWTRSRRPIEKARDRLRPGPPRGDGRRRDLRLVVIDYRVVAAAIRRPPRSSATAHASIRALIERQSRRRAAATQGECRIPIDAETERCLAPAASPWTTCSPAGTELQVRKTANLHTGGTIHDVTDELHPRLVEAAIAAARAIEIPVVGIDFMVASPRAARLRLHRGQRAAGPRQSRAAADGRALRRPAVSAVDPGAGPRRPPAPGAASVAPMTRLPIDTDYLQTRLRRFLAIPSPTGYTDTIVRDCCDELAAAGRAVRADAARRHPGRPSRAGDQRGARAIVAHLDTLGAQVKRVKDNGRLELVPIGTGRRASPRARASRSSPTHGGYRGTILPLKASGHTFNEEVDTAAGRLGAYRAAGRRLCPQPARGATARHRRSATSSPSIRSRNSWTTASSSRATSTTRPVRPCCWRR